MIFLMILPNLNTGSNYDLSTIQILVSWMSEMYGYF